MANIIRNIRIVSAARFDTDTSVSDKMLKQTLKQQNGTDARRYSRLSLLAALGANLLRRQSEIRPDCAVFLATPFSSPSVFEKMADNVFDHQTAMPFDFIANLHNAPAFHAAQILGAQGAALAVAADNGAETRFHPLLLAAQTLQNGGQAAVGWAYEHQAAHAETREGSIWILLEHGATYGASLNPDRLPQTTAPGCYWQDIADWADRLQTG